MAGEPLAAAAELGEQLSQWKYGTRLARVDYPPERDLDWNLE